MTMRVCLVYHMRLGDIIRILPSYIFARNIFIY